MTQKGRLRLVTQHLEHGRSLRELAPRTGSTCAAPTAGWLVTDQADQPLWWIDGASAAPSGERSIRNSSRRRWISATSGAPPPPLRPALKAAFSSVARALSRLGLGRLRNLEPKPPVQQYEWEHPGDLIHIDIKSLARFRKVGHRITGDRQQGRSYGVGYDKVDIVVDDATRRH